jgi:uncharacterized protein YbjT (DUF2867 family)
MKQTAVIIGATGLVGSEILNYALSDERIEKIKVFVRRTTGIVDPRLEEYIIDFEKLNGWKNEVTGDVLFSALGTTVKQVRTRVDQRVIDYDYQLRVAQAAKVNGIRNYVLVSAPGADSKSPFAYTKMKGDLERDVMKLTFDKLTIVRPGLLKGHRIQKRFFEEKAGSILSYFPVIPGLEALRPVSGKLVAHACIETAFNPQQGCHILHPKDVLEFMK